MLIREMSKHSSKHGVAQSRDNARTIPRLRTTIGRSRTGDLSKGGISRTLRGSPVVTHGFFAAAVARGEF